MANRVPIILVSIMMVSVLIGCGDDGGQVVTAKRPSVKQTSPQDGAVDTNLNPLIQVWFDDRLDEATIDSAAFHVAGAATHRLEYSDADSAIMLYPAAILEPESTYTVLVTTAIKNAHGRGMLSNFTFSFTTGPRDRDHLVDYLEPNDDMDSAAEIEVDKTYPVLGSCGADEFDYYKFTLTDTAKVTLHIDHSFSELDQTGWVLRFRVCGGPFYVPLFTHLDTGKSVNIRYSFLPGTYCVETGNTEGDVRLAVYDLTLETSAPCPDDAYEDNDFHWGAEYIAQGLHSLRGCDGDHDYFKISLDAGQTLTATVSQVPPGNLQRKLRISDMGNFTLIDSTGFEDPVTLYWVAIQDTTHHIEVKWYDDDIEYTLHVDVSD
jgi:hypothetical protein